MTRCLVRNNRVENEFDKLFHSFFHFPTIDVPSHSNFNPKVNISEDLDKSELSLTLLAISMDAV